MCLDSSQYREEIKAELTINYFDNQFVLRVSNAKKAIILTCDDLIGKKSRKDATLEISTIVRHGQNDQLINQNKLQMNL